MATLKVEVPEALVEELRNVWEFNKKHVRPDILERMGWQEWECFLGDLLAHGYRTASDAPLDFMKQVRDTKDPIFLPAGKRTGATKGEAALRFEQEFERAYS